jgi:hypothetical protein
LYIDLPNEIFAVRTERGLFEEPGNEAMIFDIKDILLLQSTLPATILVDELFLVVVGLVVFFILIISHVEFEFFLLLLGYLVYFNRISFKSLLPLI